MEPSVRVVSLYWNMTPAPDQGSSIRGMRVAKSEKIQVHFRHTWFAILASCPGLDLNLSTRVTIHNSQFTAILSL